MLLHVLRDVLFGQTQTSTIDRQTEEKLKPQKIHKPIFSVYAAVRFLSHRVLFFIFSVRRFTVLIL
jgi:hypothetical protein